MKPKVMKGLFWKFWDLRFKQKEPFIIIDLPLLYETGFFKYLLFPIFCVVVTDELEVIKRLIKRNNLTQKHAKERYDAQMHIGEKVRQADIVIDNSGNFAELSLIFKT